MGTEEMIGKRFNRLVVVAEADTRYYGVNHAPRRCWECRCDCGNTTYVVEPNLKNGLTKSCGCYHRDAASKAKKTHGESRTRLYNEWCSMKHRCNCERDKCYYRYGGRGIRVCDEWEHDYIAFRDWALANGYSPKLTLDRIDNDGMYEPANCRWVNCKEQCNNRSNNVNYTYNGETHSVTQWSEITGISYSALSQRLRSGWDFEKAITTEVRVPKQHKTSA